MNMGGPAQVPIFALGEIVSARYRISRYLGQGAAGEVYGAEDLHLRSRVALKVLRPAASRDPQSIERFKREILLARRVSHPNVCRIFDLGVHEVRSSETGAHQALLYLTMEWLEGETLARRIEEAGTFDEGPAIAVVRQLCSGLAAAHDAGVVHRDFKSSNILLVPSPDGERAVITDFGLARSSHQSSDGITITQAGGLLGTPAYMAPEQVAGMPANAGSDLYALGVVLYEMLTGALPFHGESPLEVAVKRLREPPTPIETYRAGLSARFRETIERCMAREPEKRFARAGEVIRFLDPPTALLGADRLRGERPSRIPVAGVAVLLALGIAALLWWLLPGWRARSAQVLRPAGDSVAPALAPSAAPRRAIAVLGFANATGRPEAQWLSSALSEMLTSELAASDSLRAVPGEVVVQARQDLQLELSSSLGAETLQRLRRILGADLVLLGSFTAQGGAEAPLRVDLRLQATDGSYTRPFSIEGSEPKIFALVRQGGLNLRRELGISDLAGATSPAADFAHPASPEAVRLYAGGLEALRSFEPGRARDLLERAIATDPEFPLARAALAAAWFDLGYDDQALVAASEARKRSGKLSRSDQLMVEGLERRLSRDWPRAIEVARTLWRFYPDDLEQGLRLAQVELEAGESTAALVTVAELQRLPPPAGEDPRIDLVEARAAAALSDFHRQLAVAERAATRAELAGSRSILARARFEQGAAQRKLGDSTGAAGRFEVARRLAGDLGDRAFVASVAQSLANLEQSRGDFARAERLFEEARATFAAIGNRRRAARVQVSLGLVASERGELQRARELYESAGRTLAELGDRRGAAAAAANLGTMHYLQWDLSGAEARHLEALATFRQLEDRSRELVALANLGQIRRERGDFAGSDRLWQQALELARATGDKAGEGDALLGLGENRAMQGDGIAAQRDLSAALALFDAGGEKPKAAAVRLVQARIERDNGQPSQAFAKLIVLAQEFGARGEADEKVQADLEAARCLLAQRGKSAAAAQLVGEALGAAGRNPAAWLRHLGRLVSAELDVAFGRFDRARGTLAEDLAVATRAGHRIAMLEARLGVLAVDRAAGLPASR
ncbi:MAG: eukaryotic-like serine/threonine-protein kinase, partial [Acidobacteriota bacterium]|nr:eukaryotic-like serine/threonine-protein kinase [Acidobacteriota bacterium]